MPKATLRIADEFVEGLAAIYSAKIREQIKTVLRGLENFPEMGSPDVRESLVARYGKSIRKVPVSTFVIVYRYEDPYVDVLALVYGPGVR